jgi:hypothetical protein
VQSESAPTAPDGQDPPGEQPTPKPGAAAPRALPPPPPPSPPPATGPYRFSNIRVDVTINDQSSGAKPVTKTVTLVQANGDRSSIRSSNDIAVPQRVVRDPGTPDPNAPPAMPGPPMDLRYNFTALPLNIDARSVVIDDTRVKVELQVNYETAVPDRVVRTGQPVTAKVTENLSLVLENGKPVVVSQSADAASDRRVTVEVKATILK